MPNDTNERADWKRQQFEHPIWVFGLERQLEREWQNLQRGTPSADGAQALCSHTQCSERVVQCGSIMLSDNYGIGLTGMREDRRSRLRRFPRRLSLNNGERAVSLKLHRPILGPFAAYRALQPTQVRLYGRQG